MLVNPVDHMVYSALLPEVVGGVIDPRCVATPLAASLPSTRVLIGTVTAVDIGARTCTVRGVDGPARLVAWDRLVLNPGSVTSTFGVAGVVDHARGFKTLAEALYLREQILRQLQLGSTTHDTNAGRRHATVVVVGGGFTVLELAAQGAALARAALRQDRALDLGSVRWTVPEAGVSVLAAVPSQDSPTARSIAFARTASMSVSRPRSPKSPATACGWLTARSSPRRRSCGPPG